MAFTATVIRILIASPSDVEDERESVHAIINEWNEMNTISEKIVLWPVLWTAQGIQDTRSKSKKQGSILPIDDCDILIGIFWTRTDGQAGVVDPEAMENLAKFIESGKIALLYFSSRPVVPDSIDPDQYAQLRTFKKRINEKGNIFQYSSVDELVDMVNAHVLEKVREIHSVQQTDKAEKTEKTAADQPAQETEDKEEKDTSPKEEKVSKPDVDLLIDTSQEAGQFGDSHGEREEPVPPSPEIPLGDIDIEHMVDAVETAGMAEKGISEEAKNVQDPPGEKKKKIDEKKEDSAADSELKKIKKKYMLELSRLEVEWIMERDGEPEEINDGKAILYNVSHKLMDLQFALQPKIDEKRIETLLNIIDDARNMNNHQILADGGKSYDAFWKIGNEIFQRYKEFIDKLA